MKLSSFIFIGESKAKDGVQRQKKEWKAMQTRTKQKKKKKTLQKKTERRIKTFGRRRVSKAMKLYV